MYYRHTNLCVCMSIFVVVSINLTQNAIFCVLFHEIKMYNISVRKALKNGIFGGLYGYF